MGNCVSSLMHVVGFNFGVVDARADQDSPDVVLMLAYPTLLKLASAIAFLAKSSLGYPVAEMMLWHICSLLTFSCVHCDVICAATCVKHEGLIKFLPELVRGQASFQPFIVLR